MNVSQSMKNTLLTIVVLGIGGLLGFSQLNPAFEEKGEADQQAATEVKKNEKENQRNVENQGLVVVDKEDDNKKIIEPAGKEGTEETKKDKKTLDEATKPTNQPKQSTKMSNNKKTIQTDTKSGTKSSNSSTTEPTTNPTKNTSTPPTKTDSSNQEPTQQTNEESPTKGSNDSPGQTSQVGSYQVAYKNGAFTITGTVSADAVIHEGIRIVLDETDFRQGIRNKEETEHPIVGGKVNIVVKPTIQSGTVRVNIDERRRLSDGSLDNHRVGGYDFSIQASDPYLTASSYVQSSNSSIVNLAKQLTSGKSGTLAKSTAIHHWVAKNVRYDAKSFLAGDIKNYTSLEAFQTRNVQCTGYANLSAALHRAAGIPAKVVYGSANGAAHAWNEVLIDGSWYSQDPTWNAGYIDDEKNEFVADFRTTYFNTNLSNTHNRQGVTDW